jgi:hypothetical protein
MKKLFLFAALTLLTGITIGQSIQKGTLIGTHVMTVTLQPGVTLEKFMDFYKTNIIPEMEKYYSNMKAYQRLRRTK